jgi:predicted nucleic acid binding AN1-type Zn finger protein
LGGSSTAIALLILYVFIVQPMRGGSRGSSIYSQYSSRSFQPTVIPPSRIVKKSIIKGLCQQCGKSSLMGFTCTYCNGYFCPEHRLPEKHECLGIKR